MLSQFSKPIDSILEDYEENFLPSKNIIELIEQYGEPYFIKIDIEGYDHIILKELFKTNIRPPYISAESHQADVFATLVACGGYNSFKMVEGATVGAKYNNARFIKKTGEEGFFKFLDHSAGPFGNDIIGPWMSANTILRVLGIAGLGWRDIHASRVDECDPKFFPAVSFKVEL